MANKIPVGGTIGRAYGFAFGNVINNIGVIWIPMAILYGAMFVFQGPYLDAITGMTSRDPQAVLRIFPMFLAVMLASVVILVSVYAGLTKEALGLRSGSAFLQFPFGAGTWRLLGANILFFLVMCVVYIAILIVSFIGGLILAAVIGSAKGSGNLMAAGLLVTVFVLVVACTMLYIATRLSFLLAPVTIAERRISLVRAWQLTKGNFWRIFVILLVLVIPLLILEAVYFVMVFGKDFFAGFHPGMTPDEIAQMQQHQMAASREIMERQARYWYISYPITFLVTTIVYGMFAGASAAAYKAVVPSDGSAEAEAMS